MIDRSLYTPPYVQIEASLAAEAVAWPDGTVPFHSEAAVASRFQVSRMTARRALQGLAERGLLRRARGLGSFVTAPKLVEAFTPTMQVHRAWRTLGLDVEMRVLRFEYLHPGEDACRKLELRRNAKVLYMRRLRLLAGAPIALDDRFIPPAIAKAAKLVRADLAGSILDALWRAGPLSHADWEIEARAANQEEAALLAMSPGAPVLSRNMAYTRLDGGVAGIGTSIHRADRMRYALTLPLHTPGSGEPASATPEVVDADSKEIQAG
jgi:GntR family transcriptional regulator